MQDMSARVSFPVDESEFVLKEIEFLLKIENAHERHQQILNYVERRTFQLEEKTKVTDVSLLNHSIYKGFVHPDTKIWTNLDNDPFLVNDDYIYQLMFEKLHVFLNHNNWKHMHIREVVPVALMMTLDYYFGNNWLTDNEYDREEFYKKHSVSENCPIDLAEFKHKNIASCAEKAAIAQNLLSFLGYSSLLVFSSKCQLDTTKKEAHAYNLISTHNGMFVLFDPTNPVVIYGEKDQFYSILPAFYTISDEEVHELKNGGSVEVKHQNFYQTPSGYIQKELKYRIYSG